MNPIIGIMTRPEISPEKHNIMCAYEDVITSVVQSGGIPLGILPLNKSKFNYNIFEIIDKCDGIIFQGGDDFTNAEIECMKYVYKKDIPTLGICLGMQLMSYMFGGDSMPINNLEHKQANLKYVHDVHIKKESQLYKIFKQDKIKVNSRHKYTVINSNLDITAISLDGLIEGIEDKNKKFFVGVQWHPESMTSYDILESRLFDYFINVCRK